ncbi:Uma2 family endonuclease [Candidatus Poribacteria bacterium]|nr:Uma2 family endonuclease [Candidatus Poribacteria bacterium]
MQTSSVLEKKEYTYSDYLEIDDDKRYQVLEGELIMVPAPNIEHQEISWKIEFKFSKFIMEHKLGKVFDAPCDVVLADDVVLQPDILFISKDRLNIIEKQAIKGAPDLIVEIVSDSSSFHDTIRKKSLYERFGVKEYWIVFPEEKAIEVLTLNNGVYKEFSAAEYHGKVISKIFTGFEMELKDIF